MTGIVYKSTGSWYWISTGEEYFTNAESKENSESKESKAPIPLLLATKLILS